MPCGRAAAFKNALRRPCRSFGVLVLGNYWVLEMPRRPRKLARLSLKRLDDMKSWRPLEGKGLAAPLRIKAKSFGAPKDVLKSPAVTWAGRCQIWHLDLTRSGCVWVLSTASSPTEWIAADIFKHHKKGKSLTLPGRMLQ